jgi:hypothetical protein
MSTGYSGTPLARKLGIRSGMRGAVVDAPEHYWDLLPGLPQDISIVDPSAPNLDFVHLFVTDRSGLTERLAALRDRVAPAGMIWVSWPKRASKVDTDVTEDVVRANALAAGLVDVKVCAVDDVWSGLKLVIRTADRPRSSGRG